MIHFRHSRIYMNRYRYMDLFDILGERFWVPQAEGFLAQLELQVQNEHELKHNFIICQIQNSIVKKLNKIPLTTLHILERIFSKQGCDWLM